MKDQQQPLIGILGGSFDPIHRGHVALADYLYHHLPLTQIQFVPCELSPLKQQTYASAHHRTQMIQLAIADYAYFTLNTCELSRTAPSYSIDTLIELKQQHSQAQFAFIIGEDVLMEFNQWQRWQDFLMLAHLIVVKRPGVTWKPKKWLQDLLEQHQCFLPGELLQHAAGKILLQSPPPQDICSTRIREKIALGKDVAIDVDQKVLQYILKNNLYL